MDFHNFIVDFKKSLGDIKDRNDNINNVYISAIKLEARLQELNTTRNVVLRWK